MKLILEVIEKYRSQGAPALVLLAEQDKLLGNLPRDRSNLQAKVQTVLKNQAAKVLNDSLELIAEGEQLIAVFQLPAKKGLNREDRIRLAASRIGEWLKSRSLTRMAVSVDQFPAKEFRALCEGFLIAAYDFRKYKSDKKAETGGGLEIVLLSSGEGLKRNATALAESEAICRQINVCRDLVNEPGSHLDPQDFAEFARKAAKEFNLTVKVRDEKKLQSDGYMGLWTVGKGSDRPPRMVTLGYDGGKARSAPKRGADAPHLVLVGKGVTFDTGGISIKPSQGMWEMKCDMAGAATVLGALCAISVLKLPIKVSAVLCLAENRPGNAAVLPGDIFTAKNGKTIMVDNTDAEGRLILTDGLAEAGSLGATHIVDLATLTGAIVRAIGPSIAGMFSNDPEFTQTMFKAAENAGEKFCALPLEEEYREYLDDPVADMKNVGKPEAGAITAALFLQEFVPAKTAWSHWDIAGTAFTTSTWKYYKPGGTGWGVKSLVEVARLLATPG
ncbi:MAG: leucyl aminopeptidase family protein [Fibrobacteria bacterium]